MAMMCYQCIVYRAATMQLVALALLLLAATLSMVTAATHVRSGDVIFSDDYFNLIPDGNGAYIITPKPTMTVCQQSRARFLPATHDQAFTTAEQLLVWDPVSPENNDPDTLYVQGPHNTSVVFGRTGTYNICIRFAWQSTNFGADHTATGSTVLRLLRGSTVDGDEELYRTNVMHFTTQPASEADMWMCAELEVLASHAFVFSYRLSAPSEGSWAPTLDTEFYVYQLTEHCTVVPVSDSTFAPTDSPTGSPTTGPTAGPTRSPSANPTAAPTTGTPTGAPVPVTPSPGTNRRWWR